MSTAAAPGVGTAADQLTWTLGPPQAALATLRLEMGGGVLSDGRYRDHEVDGLGLGALRIALARVGQDLL
ncbi:MAG: hypothetical protein ACRDZ3_22380, partial [Acidimicrobiia bacterium]